MPKLKNRQMSKVRKICFCSLFAAIICACTFISVPLPFGYFNLGDGAILLCAWSMGAGLGAISAAIGSALADILMGFVIYAPATAIIKAAIAISAFYMYRLLSAAFKSRSSVPFCCIISAIVGEVLMVSGYFLYECLILGYGLAATASILGNVLQGVCAVIISTCAFSLLKKSVFEKLSQKL